ncbi:plasmid mobilization protein [Microbacterium sp.]|uniref:plasmid mobilization protein n=1 Tax=Microbacterium sp. TaxID=51671 RepID=UPI0039E5CCFC
MSVTPGKKLLTLEVTPEQKARIEENAAWWGESIAAYVRAAALGETIERPRNRRKVAA